MMAKNDVQRQKKHHFEEFASEALEFLLFVRESPIWEGVSAACLLRDQLQAQVKMEVKLFSHTFIVS